MVAIDIRKLRPTEIVKLLNSTKLGSVISERQMRRHREEAGYRIGEAQSVDLLRYCGWLAFERHRPREKRSVGYEGKKLAAQVRQQELSRAGRDIGAIPDVVDEERKQNCERHFRAFCESYFPATFTLGWSDDHLRVLDRIQTAVLDGGLFALGMPRGSGKSTLAEVACIWSMLYGHREFVCLIGSDEGSAASMLDSIKSELENNDEINDDFPEVCFPIRKLDGIANRCAGQLHNGKRTMITWTAKQIVLPTIAGSVASGSVVQVAGITGRIRGMKSKRADGSTIRPSLVVIDDPQTDESARSVSQSEQRESILAGAVLGLAGPGEKISGIMPCTVIRPGDMADSILNRDKHPEWNGERTRMVYQFPKNVALWDKYGEMRAEGLRAGDGGKSATEFYVKNRKKMDAGAVVAWEERFNHDEVSAIQHAMNLRLRDESAFFSEYQNEPIAEDVGDSVLCEPDQIIEKANGLERGVLRIGTDFLTAFIDVQQKCLFFAVVGWSSKDFSGAVVDYGTWPDQRRSYFTLAEVQRTLARKYKGQGVEGSIYSGLDELVTRLMTTTFRRESDDAELRTNVVLVDAGWQTETIRLFTRRTPFASTVRPTHGRFIGASGRPMDEHKVNKREMIGHHWRTSIIDKQVHILTDVNYWKTFLHQRLAVPFGDRSCLSLFGKPNEHRMLADHLNAEKPVRVSSQNRTLDEWKIRPGRTENHLFDCLVGCCVGASIVGCSLETFKEQKRKRKQARRRRSRVRYS